MGRSREQSRSITERNYKVKALISIGFAAVMLAGIAGATVAQAGSYYDSRGNHVGSSSTDSGGTTRYYDSRGNHTGTRYR